MEEQPRRLFEPGPPKARQLLLAGLLIGATAQRGFEEAATGLTGRLLCGTARVCSIGLIRVACLEAATGLCERRTAAGQCFAQGP